MYLLTFELDSGVCAYCIASAVISTSLLAATLKVRGRGKKAMKGGKVGEGVGGEEGGKAASMKEVIPIITHPEEGELWCIACVGGPCVLLAAA